MNKDPRDSSRTVRLSDSQIIDRFGGIRPMAAKLGIAVTTVQGWKARGHIPENRRQSIIEAARAAGIDLGEAQAPAPARTTPATSATPQGPATEPAAAGRGASAPATRPDSVALENAGKQERPEPQDKRKSPGPQERIRPEKPAPQSPAHAPRSEPAPAGHLKMSTGIAWIALALSVLLVGALFTRPYWEPTVHGSAAADLSDLERALDGLTGESRTRFGELGGRVAALEAGGGEAGAALATQLATLETNLSDIGRTLSSLDRGMQGVEGRLAELEAARGEVPEHVTAALRQAAQEIEAANAVLAALRAETMAQDERLTALETRPVQTGERIAALALGIGQVETALNAGRPYRAALDRLVEIAPEDQLVLDGVSTLYDRSADGIPGRPALQRRFAEIASEIDRALADTGGDSWIDRTWHSLSTVITVRRQEGPDASPVSRAENALADGDLTGVVDAFGGAGSLGSVGDAWLNDVRARIEAENEVEALYGRVIAQLAATGNPTQ